MVGGRLMGVGSDHQAGAAVDEMAEADLLAGRLGVEIDHHRIRLLAERAGRQLALDRLERIVELRMHEHPAHDVGDQHPGAVLGDEDAGTSARRAGREIDRSQEALRTRGEFKRLALVPDMVAGGHRIGAGGERG